MNTIFDYISLIASLAALVISGISIWVQKHTDIRNNELNLEAIYHNKIFQDHLIFLIPQARRRLRIPDNNIPVATDLINELKELRKDSLYYCYSNKAFYDKLVQVLDELEDFLVISEGKCFVGEDQTEFFNKVQDKINAVYKCITDMYKGH